MCVTLLVNVLNIHLVSGRRNNKKARALSALALYLTGFDLYRISVQSNSNSISTGGSGWQSRQAPSLLPEFESAPS